jgi:hypothetical protein
LLGSGNLSKMLLVLLMQIVFVLQQLSGEGFPFFTFATPNGLSCLSLSQICGKDVKKSAALMRFW